MSVKLICIVAQSEVHLFFLVSSISCYEMTCFPDGAIMNRAATSIHLQIIFWLYPSFLFGKYLRADICLIF